MSVELANETDIEIKPKTESGQAEFISGLRTQLPE